MTELQPGDEAPLFEADDETGRTWRLADLEGRPVVLYFYPRDDTPGCTKEACSFRDAMPELEDHDAVVLGVSDDDAESHRAFKDKRGLNFPLLVDTDGELADRYGAWAKKKMFGNEFWGVERKTFLIDAEGQIAHAWPSVDPEDHAEEVLQALAKLDGESS